MIGVVIIDSYVCILRSCATKRRCRIFRLGESTRMYRAHPSRNLAALSIVYAHRILYSISCISCMRASAGGRADVAVSSEGGYDIWNRILQEGTHLTTLITARTGFKNSAVSRKGPPFPNSTGIPRSRPFQREVSDIMLRSCLLKNRLWPSTINAASTLPSPSNQMPQSA